MKDKYAVVLNFETSRVDVLYLGNISEDFKDEWGGYDVEDYIQAENGLDYNLSNCQWMVTDDITMYKLNY